MLNIFLFYLLQGHTGYAVKDDNCEMSKEDKEKLNLSKFGESDNGQHQQKMVISFGCCFGLQGSTEHTNLTLDNIAHSKVCEDLYCNLMLIRISSK